MTAHVGLPHLHRYATALTFLALTTAACSAGSDTSDTDTATAATPDRDGCLCLRDGSRGTVTEHERDGSRTRAPRSHRLPALLDWV